MNFKRVINSSVYFYKIGFAALMNMIHDFFIRVLFKTRTVLRGICKALIISS